jgi:hypothetical protein
LGSLEQYKEYNSSSGYKKMKLKTNRKSDPIHNKNFQSLLYVNFFKNKHNQHWDAVILTT